MQQKNKRLEPTLKAIKQLAHDWLAYYEIIHDPEKNTQEFRQAIQMGSHPLSYVHNATQEYINDWPDLAWSLIEILMAEAGSEDIRSDIAAGPLEDLLTQYPYAFIDRVEDRSRKDPVFRSCLREVWQGTIPDDVWQRIQDVSK